MKNGDYVRTNSGFISKLGYYDKETQRWIVFQNNDWYPIYESSVKISSPNIIDLIEVGDYVNGHTVKMIKEDKSKIDIGEGEDYFWLRNQDILSIVTKEQFESIEYKVGD